MEPNENDRSLAVSALVVDALVAQTAAADAPSTVDASLAVTTVQNADGSVVQSAAPAEEEWPAAPDPLTLQEVVKVGEKLRSLDEECAKAARQRAKLGDVPRTTTMRITEIVGELIAVLPAIRYTVLAIENLSEDDKALMDLTADDIIQYRVALTVRNHEGKNPHMPGTLPDAYIAQRVDTVILRLRQSLEVLKNSPLVAKVEAVA